MKNLRWYSLSLLLLVMVCCKNDENFLNVANSASQTLIATYSSEAASKASLTISGDSTVSLTWSTGDCFTVYKVEGETSTLVGDFTLSGTPSTTSVFTANEGVRLTEGETYQAVYPQSAAPTLAARDTVITTILAQDAVSGSTSAAFYMKSGEFKYTSDSNTVNFADDISSSDVSIGYLHDKINQELIAIVITIGDKRMVVPIKERN